MEVSLAWGVFLNSRCVLPRAPIFFKNLSVTVGKQRFSALISPWNTSCVRRVPVEAYFLNVFSVSDESLRMNDQSIASPELSSNMPDASRHDESAWWRGGVIYQIYPRSFQDSNGDGVGDLLGITERLPYVASLGVDAIWISPFFKSPMKDFGYDVADYRDVDPLFGNLADFDTLIGHAHGLGLKLIIDQVLSHTSDQHDWFKESRSSRDNPKADWYVWVDPQPDGSPPNNWVSVFGGSAWQWDSRRRQYYLHNFLTTQPDLNFHHPAVQQAMVEEVRFWCERGVDGFRFDACNFHFHDQQLRSNPPMDPDGARTVRADNPYAMQRHLYDKSQPENLAFLERLRRLLDEYGAASVGEVGDETALSLMAQYTSTLGTPRLHMAYSFNLLTDEKTVAHVRSQVEELETNLQPVGGWGCWSLNNHDVPRVVSRWGLPLDQPQAAKVVAAMLCSLRGSVCLYQGEELGLPEADVPYELIQDPYGLAFWPEFKGRDGCRTPLPWESQSTQAGFTIGQPWLPIPAEHRERAVDVQEQAPDSVLHFYRAFLSWRRQIDALKWGDIHFDDAPEPVMMLRRCYKNRHILAVFNLGAEETVVPLPASVLIESTVSGSVLTGADITVDGSSLHLAPWGGGFFELKVES